MNNQLLPSAGGDVSAVHMQPGLSFDVRFNIPNYLENDQPVSWSGRIDIGADGAISSVTNSWVRGSIPADECTSASEPGIAAASQLEKQEKIAAALIGRIQGLANSNANLNLPSFLDRGSYSAGTAGSFRLNANENGFTTSFATSLGHVWEQQRRREALPLSHQLAERLNGPAMKSAAERPYQSGTYGPGLSDSQAIDPKRFELESAAYGLINPENDLNAAADASNVASLTEAQHRGYDIWMQVLGEKSELGDDENSLWVGYLGSHVFINPELLVGALVQVDWSDSNNETDGSFVNGTGWMAGPYIAAKLPDHPIYFDARAAWGQSKNTLKASDVDGEDDFDTERWLVSGKISGVMKVGRLTIRPALSATHISERQQAFTDNLGLSVSGQKISIGEIRFGPTFSLDYINEDGFVVRPSFGIAGVWNFDVNAGALDSANTVLGSEELRAQLNFGLTAIGTDHWSFDLQGHYDGLGINDYYSYGGKARLTVQLQ